MININSSLEFSPDPSFLKTLERANQAYEQAQRPQDFQRIAVTILGEAIHRGADNETIGLWMNRAIAAGCFSEQVK